MTAPLPTWRLVTGDSMAVTAGLASIARARLRAAAPLLSREVTT